MAELVETCGSQLWYGMLFLLSIAMCINIDLICILQVKLILRTKKVTFQISEPSTSESDLSDLESFIRRHRAKKRDVTNALSPLQGDPKRCRKYESELRKFIKNVKLIMSINITPIRG